MAIIITYDIPSKHVEFKKAVFLMGYQRSDSWNKLQDHLFSEHNALSSFKKCINSQGGSTNYLHTSQDRIRKMYCYDLG